MSQKFRPVSQLGKVQKSFISIWLVMTIFSLAGSAAIIWAVIHFIRKYW